MRAARHANQKWMERALALARRGAALTSPNPMVGAVVVQQGHLVGEGFHTYDGLRHAEVIALEAAGSAARGATLYVNLEPCCHTGRTGPCAEAIITAGVGRVVAAMPDPNPAVSGRSFRKLRAAGVRVDVGTGEAEARRLNESFARWIRAGRPLVKLKLAMTLDGQIASPARDERWITSRESRAEVQHLRHLADAVLTGIGTVLADNPRLTDRTGEPRRRPLLRVVLDSRLRLPRTAALVESARGDVAVFTSVAVDSARARALSRAGVDVVRMPSRRGRPDLKAVMREMGQREILSVLLETGPTLTRAALEAGIVDKLFFFYSPKILGGAHRPALLPRYSALRHAPMLRNLCLHQFGTDFAVEGYLRDVYRHH